MITALKRIIKGISESMTGVLNGIACGMIYENTVICNGIGGARIESSLLS